MITPLTYATLLINCALSNVKAGAQREGGTHVARAYRETFLTRRCWQLFELVRDLHTIEPIG